MTAMKRKIAALLSMVMLVQVLYGIPLKVQAQTLNQVVLTQLSVQQNVIGTGGSRPPQGISYNDNTKKLQLTNQLKDNEVAMKWSIGQGNQIEEGVYTLKYYIHKDGYEEILATNAVTLQFYVGKKVVGQGDDITLEDDQHTIGMTMAMYEGDDPNQAKQRTYRKYQPPYRTGDVIATHATTVYADNISLNPESTLREREVVVDNNRLNPVQIFYENGEIYVSVQDIKKGYITPFKLSYTTHDGLGVKQSDGFSAFKGLASFQVKPTHLLTDEEALVTDEQFLDETLALPSKKTIRVDELEAMPGKRPGVVVQFVKPQVINVPKDGKGGVFVPIDQTYEEGKEEDIPKVELLLTEAFGIGQTTEGKKHRVVFDLKKDATLHIPEQGGSVKGRVVEHGNQFEIYFSKENIRQENDEDEIGTVHVWEHLQEGMLLTGDMGFVGGYFHTQKDYFGDIKETIDPNRITYEVASSKVAADHMGYTYVYYEVHKSSEKDISFKIKPYNINEGEIVYSLFKVGIDGRPVLVETRTYQGKPEANYIHITTTRGRADETYWIGIDTGHERGKFQSQNLIYNEKNDIAPVHYPQILSFDNIYVVPNDILNNDSDPTASSKPEAIGLDITWSAPALRDLENYLAKGDLFYELFLGEDENKDYGLTKVFRVYKDENNLIQVELYAGSGGSESKKGIYDSVARTFKVEDIHLKRPKEQIVAQEDSYKWETLEITPSTYLQGTTYPKVVPTESPIKIQAQDTLAYTIPGTYYFKMRSVYELATKDKTLARSDDSKVKVLSLDSTKEILPTVTEITAEDDSRDGEYAGQINFDCVNLTRYIQYMFSPAGIHLTHPEDEAFNHLSEEEKRNRRTYEIYIYQQQDEDIAIRDEEVLVIPKEKITIEGMQMVVDLEDYGDILRQGAVIRIDQESYQNKGHQEQIRVKGLAPNTPYYAQMRVKVDRFRQVREGEWETLTPTYSILSKHVSFTTDTQTLPPTPEEEIPPAPSKFWEEEPRPGKNTVALRWEEGDFRPSKDGKVYYEMVRVDGHELPAMLNDRGMSIEALINSPLTQKDHKFFHTAQAYTKVYNPLSKTWEKVTPHQETTRLRLEDQTLLPNAIYYYYIRTVHQIGDKAVRSNFIMLPITTDPLGRPIGLRVESPKNYNYDTTKEVVIRFQAPIPQGEKIGKDRNYDFHIAIKGDEDQLYYLANDQEDDRPYSASFVEEVDASGVYRTFIYRIRGLKHSSRYDLKVRVVDQSRGGDKVLTSLYSDKLSIRTDFNEEEQDKENAFNELIDRYDKEAEKLKHQPYWKVEGGSRQGIYKYRASFIDHINLQQTPYTLVLEENMSYGYYYLPKEMLSEVQKKSSILALEIDDYTIYLRPGMLDLNKQIKQAEEDVKHKRIKDYYIGVQVEVKTTYGTVYGQQRELPELNVTMEVVGVTEEDRMIEVYIEEALIERIDEGRMLFIDALEKQLDRKLDTVVLERMIQDEISKLKSKHERDVRFILNRRQKQKQAIDELQKEMLIVAKAKNKVLQGYYKRSFWEEVYTYQVLDGFGFETKQLGTYVFVLKMNQTHVLPHLPGAQDLISKYQLGDFFSFDAVGLKSYVTKRQFYGTVARLIGARPGSDAIGVLTGRGIRLVAPYNDYQTIRYDETVYVLMQAYEKMYYRPIGSIAITNRQKLQNGNAFQVVYRPYIYAAAELGVIDTQRDKAIPSRGVSTEELIRMVLKIMPK